MEYKKIQGSQLEKPKEVDMTSSPHTVYVRKNIVKVEKEASEDVSAINGWEYDECEMSREEYETMQNALESPAMVTVMQAISNLELSIAMQGVE